MHIASGICDAADERIVDLRTGKPYIASDKNRIAVQKTWQEKTDFIYGIPVEIDIVYSSDIVGLKCSH